MKRNSGFFLSDVAGNHLLVPVGKAVADFNGVVSLNEMGRVIWDMLEQNLSEDELAEAVAARYEVSAERAREDIGAFLKVLRKAGCLEE